MHDVKSKSNAAMLLGTHLINKLLNPVLQCIHERFLSFARIFCMQTISFSTAKTNPIQKRIGKTMKQRSLDFH
jgi:hypothetical protein